jgi:hypothetical protein
MPLMSFQLIKIVKIYFNGSVDFTFENFGKIYKYNFHPSPDCSDCLSSFP